MTKKNKAKTETFRLGTDPERVLETLDQGLDLTGTIDDVIFKLNEAKRETSLRGFSQLRIEAYYPGYDGGCILELQGFRDETSKEIMKRVQSETLRKAKYDAAESKRIEDREKSERKELARLKKLYEKQVSKNAKR